MINRQVKIEMQCHYSFPNGVRLPDTILHDIGQDETFDAYSEVRVTIDDHVWSLRDGEWFDEQGEPYEVLADDDEDDE